MAIQNEITRISNAKSSIKQAIESKGVDIPSSTLIDGYSDYVDNIVIGGVVDMEKFLSTDGMSRLVLTPDIQMPVTTVSWTENDVPFLDCQGIKELVIQSDTIIPNNTFAYLYASQAPWGAPIEKITIESAAYCERDYIASETATNPNLSYALVWGIPTTKNNQVPLCSKVVIDCQPTRLGNHFLSDFVNLTSLDIPSAVTELGTMCFSSCGFEIFTIPSQITTLGNEPFRKCLSLHTVYCEPTTPPTAGKNIFNGCTALTHIYVPSESVESYKQASEWSKYASIIEAMPS